MNLQTQFLQNRPKSFTRAVSSSSFVLKHNILNTVFTWYKTFLYDGIFLILKINVEELSVDLKKYSSYIIDRKSKLQIKGYRIITLLFYINIFMFIFIVIYQKAEYSFLFMQYYKWLLFFLYIFCIFKISHN